MKIKKQNEADDDDDEARKKLSNVKVGHELRNEGSK